MAKTLKMYREADRLETFENFPLHFLDSYKLAKSGCYNLGGYKGVQCYFCKVIIRRWYPSDDEIQRHLKKGPKCPLLTLKRTCNIPTNVGELNKMLSSITTNSSYNLCYMDVD